MKASYGAWLTPYARFITSSKAARSPAGVVTRSVSHSKLYSTAEKGDTLHIKCLQVILLQVILKFH